LRRADPIAAVLLGIFAACPAPAQDRAVRGDAVVAEINRVRADPRAYARELRSYRTRFDGKIVTLPGRDDRLMTEEGVAAVDEAIRFLDRQPPLPALLPSAIFNRAAADHVRDQGGRSATGHVGSDGSSPGIRVQRRGGLIYVAESITYGPERADDAVRQLIIDDAVPKRGHRKMMFDTRWRHAGAACGSHQRYRSMCVIEFGETANGDVRTPVPRE
jgi:uncharacterized protein YkwD